MNYQIKKHLPLFILSIFACVSIIGTKKLMSNNSVPVAATGTITFSCYVDHPESEDEPFTKDGIILTKLGNGCDWTSTESYKIEANGGVKIEVDQSVYSGIKSISVTCINGTGNYIKNSGTSWSKSANSVSWSAINTTQASVSLRNDNRTSKMQITSISVTVYYKYVVDVTSSNEDYGTVSGSGAVIEGGQTTITATPKTGYKFDGWYNGSSLISSSASYTVSPTENMFLTGKFSPKNLSITYQDKGGNSFSGTHENGYPTSHTYGTATALKSATKTGFIFGGWFDSSDCSGSAISSIGATSYSENITLYALWTEDSSYKPTLVNSLGGYIKENDTKKLFVAFGFQVSSTVYNSLVNNSDFGIIAFKSGSSEVEYSNGTIDSLKTNEGRFYIYMTVESQTPVTYYAKAFVKYNGTYIYSSLVSKTGDLSGTLYTIE